MRLIILILTSGILLSYPNLLLAQSPEQKTKILIDEWKEAVKPKLAPLEINKEIKDAVPNLKVESPNSELPLAFDKKITLRSSGVNLKRKTWRRASVSPSPRK